MVQEPTSLMYLEVGKFAHIRGLRLSGGYTSHHFEILFCSQHDLRFIDYSPGCSMNTALFDEIAEDQQADPVNPSSGRRAVAEIQPEVFYNSASFQRNLVSLRTVSVERNQTIQASDCLCPIGGAARRSPTVEEFDVALQETLASSGFVGSIELVKEVDQVPCTDEAPIVEFSSSTIIELNVDCPIDEFVVNEIADNFLAFYNTFASENYCDPFDRQIVSVQLGEVVPVTERSTQSFELFFDATCKGCTADDFVLFDSALSAEDLGRRRLQSKNLCFCHALSPNRAPDESELIQAFGKELDARSDLECFESLGSCEAPTRFNTQIVITFLGDPKVLQDDPAKKAQLEQTMLETINAFFAVTEDECNPDFREVTNVTAAQIGLEVNQESVSIMSFLGSRGRLPSRFLLDFEFNDTTILDLNDTVTNETATSLPTQFPTSSPIAEIGSGLDLFEVLLFVQGTCNGVRIKTYFIEHLEFLSFLSTSHH